ncbi:MFS transporter [Salibacterium sp. K-3]
MSSATNYKNTTEHAGLKEWLGLFILTLPTLLLSLDVTVLHLALPHFAMDLQANSTQQLWILDIYGFMIAGFLVTMGSLGDRIGRKRLLITGAGAFGMASIAAAYSTSAEMLILTRALLGISGATLMPSTLALLRNMFQNPKQRTFAISVWMMSFSGGAVLGPVVGGILLEFFWWGSVFLLGVPVMVLLLITGPFLLPEYREMHPNRLDLFSVTLSITSTLFIIYGIKEITRIGWQVIPLLFLLLGLIIGWSFIKRQVKLRNPLIDLKLFRSKAFSGSLGLMLLGMTLNGGFVLLFVQYLQMVLGMTPLEAGVWMIPLSTGSIIGSLITPLLLRWTSRTNLIAIGLSISALAYLLMIFATDSTMAVPITSSVLLTLGFGPLFVLSTDLIIASAPPEKSGSAASLSETCGELGMALGIAIFGSISIVIYRFQIEIPNDISSEFAETSRDSLSGALSVVEQMPVDSASKILIQAHGSFMTAWNIVGIIGFLLLIVLVILTFTLIREEKGNQV